MAKSARDPGDLRNRLFLRKNELAYVLGCSTTSISHWVRSGKIPKPIKIGGTPGWSMEVVRELLTGRWPDKPDPRAGA
jgi:predicted DNA-binding transcriptional regulator AlpA